MHLQVYTSLKELIENHVQEALKQFLGESLDKLIFMKKMNECWISHCQQMIMTRYVILVEVKLGLNYLLRENKTIKNCSILN
jgi:cullin-4